MSGPPPPPPPHGENPKTTSPNMPPGKYDIFIIPPHSSGSGFLYLPSLKPNVNSFAAGFASALVLVVLGHSMAPAFKTWWNGFQGMGSVGIMLLVIGVAMGAWALGRTQTDSGSGPGGGFGGAHSWGPNAGGGFNWAGAGGPTPDTGGPPPPPPPHGSPPPPQSGPTPGTPGGEKPKSSWQQRPEPEQAPPQEERQQAPPPPKPQPPPPKPQPPPPPKPQPPPPKSQPPPPKPQPPPPKPEPEPQPKPAPQANPWEKAREETRKREAERKAKEAEQKRKEEIAKRLKELREKEARERAKREQVAKEKADKEAQEKAQREKEVKEKAEQEAREKEQREKEQKEKELKEKLAKEKELRETRLREARERDLRERLEREKALREKLEKEAKEREATRLKEEAAETARKSTYAFSSPGEKFNPWPGGRPPSQPSSPATPNPNPSSAKRPPAPTARTFTGTTDEDTYSYRPYDEPKRHSRRRSGETVFTESSYAPSQSTARTSPPPSVHGPYSTKDPNKIVIKAVYGFMNQFAKTPASQLLSGQGPVTDGLILRITTEGLFIDDDVRGVPQREWDVKAWTLKLMEVWCSSSAFPEMPAPQAKTPNLLHRPARTRVDRGVPKVLTGDEADKFCESMLRTCKDECRLCPHGDYDFSYANSNAGGQSGEWKQRGLHVLRATIRDQEGKRYMFVLGEEEGWKVALGLQRLRKGTQVRQLGVQPMSPHEARNTLETLGWP
ncbi:hypothetical protein SUNI508_02470 [Seiridium unicorne]|uniref:Uncharacterized protein n=1 Tax=Seiridium unicorne TaxID=138068 RepID=A0ABR2UFJ8_9PEZI